MLMITPQSLYGSVGTTLSALIVVACLIGFTLHSDVFSGTPRKDFFWYYTNLSNLLVAFYFSCAAPVLYARSALRRFIPFAEFSVTMSILLTHAVFHLVIFPGIRPQLKRFAASSRTRMLAVNNLVVHYVVPWLVLLYYLLCAPRKNAVPLIAAPLWLLFPLAYSLVIFLHARRKKAIPGTQRLYPYPFMDISLLGQKRVMLTCAGLAAICALSSVAALLIVRALYSLLGGGKALVLVG